MNESDGVLNPVTQLREARLGLTKAAFARLTGLPYADIVKTEGGYVQTLPKRVGAALAKYGIEDSDEQYARWRRSLQESAPHLLAPESNGSV